MRTLEERINHVVSLLTDPELTLSPREAFSYYATYCNYEFSRYMAKLFTHRMFRLAHKLDDDTSIYALRKEMKNL